MRVLLKVSMPVETANARIKDGSIGQIFQTFMEEHRPEATYFAAENGRRTAFIFMDIQDSSQLPSIAEPFFLCLNASIECTPVMNGEDLGKGLSAVEEVVRKYG